MFLSYCLQLDVKGDWHMHNRHTFFFFFSESYNATFYCSSVKNNSGGKTNSDSKYKLCSFRILLHVDRYMS